MNKTAEPANEQAEASQPERLNIFQRAAGVFASPQQTFADIARRPDWITPLIFVVLATVILTQLSVPAILSDYATSDQLEKMIQRRNLTEEQTDRAMEMARTQMKNFSAVSAGVGVILISLVTAAVLLFMGNIVLGGAAGFKQVFAVYCWGGLVAILGYLLRIPLVLQQVTTKVYFGPAVLFPADAENTPLFKVAIALDVFILWRMALVAVGFAAIYRFSLGKSFATVGGLYVLLIAISVIFSGIFGG